MEPETEMMGIEGQAIQAQARREEVTEDDDKSLADNVWDFLVRAQKDIRDTDPADAGKAVVAGVGAFGYRTLEFLTEQLGDDDNMAHRLLKGLFTIQAEAAESTIKGMPTETAKILGESAPYLLTGAATMPAAGATATALGVGKFGEFLVYMGVNAMSDAGTAFVGKSSEQPNLANLIVEMSKQKDAHVTAAIAPFIDFLAIDNDDPAILNRARNGAIEAFTNVAAELGLLLPKYSKDGLTRLLNGMRESVRSGALDDLAQKMIEQGAKGDALKRELLEEGTQGITLLHGGGLPVDPRAIEIYTYEGARKFGQALQAINDRVRAGKSALPVNFDDARGRLSRKLKREAKATGPDEVLPGLAINEGRVLPGLPQVDKAGVPTAPLPPIHVGRDMTMEGWLGKVEGVLGPDQISDAATWYSQIREVFTRYVGEDDAPIYMTAWLAANQNVDPSGALMNSLRTSEKLLGALEKSKKAGFTEGTVSKIFLDELAADPRGVGQKIYDFVDSALERKTRTFYGDAAEAGAPAVIDVHSLRDMGYVDEPWQKFLKEKYGVDVSIDLKGTPSETQYEAAANRMRVLTDELNEARWMGRSDWQPAQVQAIGWRAQTELMREFQDPEFALASNLRRVSFEVAPGEGAALAKKYGQRFADLPVYYQAQVTREVGARANAIAEGVTGVRVNGHVYGSGGWEDYPLQPAINAQTLSSPEAAEAYANVIGYLTQQSEVWVNAVGRKNGNATAIDFIEIGSDTLSDDVILRSFWQNLREADTTGLLSGVQPIRTPDGEVGIRALVLGGQGKTRKQQLAELQEVLTPILERGNIDLRMDINVAQVTIAKSENPNGKGYLERLDELGATGGIRRDLGSDRSQLEAYFGESLERAERELKQGRGRKVPGTVDDGSASPPPDGGE